MFKKTILALSAYICLSLLPASAAFATGNSAENIPVNIKMLDLKPGMTLAQATAIVEKHGGSIKALGPHAAYKGNILRLSHSGAKGEIFKYRATIGKSTKTSNKVRGAGRHYTPYQETVITGPVVEVDIYTYPTKLGDFETAENLVIFGLMQSQTLYSPAQERQSGFNGSANTQIFLNALKKEYGDLHEYNIQASQAFTYILDGDTSDMEVINPDIILESVHQTIHSDGRSYDVSKYDCHRISGFASQLITQGPGHLSANAPLITEEDIKKSYNHRQSSQNAFDNYKKCGRAITIIPYFTHERTKLRSYMQFYTDFDLLTKATIAMMNFYHPNNIPTP